MANLAVIVILAGALGFSLLRLEQQDNLASLRSSALEAATTYGAYLSSYDYRNLYGPGSSWSQVERHATPAFQKQFASTSSEGAKPLGQYSATARGQVIAAGLASVTASQAVVLLFIDQTVTSNVQRPNTLTRPLRVELTMLHRNGQWLISSLSIPK